jgi:hypothetical protein
MKTLLINFLFFVAAALILIQCAMLFPSDSQPAKAKIKVKPNTINQQKRGKLIATITNISVGIAESGR